MKSILRADQIRWRLNVVREKARGGLTSLGWLELLSLLPKSSTCWPHERFALPDLAELCKYITPLGELYGPPSDRAALGGTALEVLSGAYDFRAVSVHPDDVVIDLGAHLGTFTRLSLRRGAKQVVAVEASPTNAGFLRRSFSTEIRQNRVAVVQCPIWSSKTVVRFEGRSLTGHVSNSGEEMQTTTVDEIVTTLSLPRVDFIKADIEGAERHALQGAIRTIAAHRPKLAFCVYHYPDDPEVLGAFAHEHGYHKYFDGSGRYIYCW